MLLQIRNYLNMQNKGTGETCRQSPEVLRSLQRISSASGDVQWRAPAVPASTLLA